MNARHPASAAVVTEYVTVWIGDELFGLPIARVQDVFAPERITCVPLAPPEIAGVLNLRGRIVTMIDMRRRLGMEAGADARRMAVGIELGGESYGLLIDAVGEVLTLGEDTREPNPINLERRVARVSSGVHRLDNQLLIALNVERVLELGGEAMAA